MLGNSCLTMLTTCCRRPRRHATRVHVADRHFPLTGWARDEADLFSGIPCLEGKGTSIFAEFTRSYLFRHQECMWLNVDEIVEGFGEDTTVGGGGPFL